MTVFLGEDAHTRARRYAHARGAARGMAGLLSGRRICTFKVACIMRFYLRKSTNPPDTS